MKFKMYSRFAISLSSWNKKKKKRIPAKSRLVYKNV